MIFFKKFSFKKVINYMRLIFVIFLAATNFLTVTQVFADKTPQKLAKYEIGTGAKYIMTLDKEPSEVTISFVSQTANTLVIEIFIQSLSDSSISEIKMW